MVEQRPFKALVAGSSPAQPTPRYGLRFTLCNKCPRAAPNPFGVGCGFESRPNHPSLWLASIFCAVLTVDTTSDQLRISDGGLRSIAAAATTRRVDLVRSWKSSSLGP